MTDITELARERLKEKFDAWWEREYKHLESSKYTDAVPHIKYGFWMAYQAGGAELVEALEKAQKQTTESENRVRKQNRHICELFDDNTALRQRIAELESRTVKLPPKVDSSNVPFAGHAWNCCLDEVEKCLAAAGIKVEAE
ncbi:RelE family toxin-antitoxin system [Klebsiella pneumoniae]|nr:RelE family toxin-antitoxin system [Klebsiella pneumoniae]